MQIHIFQALSKRLYFGRDPVGRRSLLIHQPTFKNPHFLLMSVSAGDDPGYDGLEELSTDHLFYLDFAKLTKVSNVSLIRHIRT